MSERHKYTATEIQTQHRRLFLDYRSQNRLIQSESFAEAWGCANDADRKFILRIFNNPNTLTLKHWILRMLCDGFEKYSYDELRQLASQHRIEKYSRMSREQLLEVLTPKGIPNGSTNIK